MRSTGNVFIGRTRGVPSEDGLRLRRRPRSVIRADATTDRVGPCADEMRFEPKALRARLGRPDNTNPVYDFVLKTGFDKKKKKNNYVNRTPTDNPESV